MPLPSCHDTPTAGLAVTVPPVPLRGGDRCLRGLGGDPTLPGQARPVLLSCILLFPCSDSWFP